MSRPTDKRLSRERSPLTGEYAAKVTPEHKLVIYAMHEQGLSTRRIGASLDLHHSTVATILRERDAKLSALYEHALEADEQFLLTIRANAGAENADFLPDEKR